MIEGQLGEEHTLGAGMIFARGKEWIYIATANHVVRKGTLLAHDIRVKLRVLPDVFLPGKLLEHADPDLDLAVLSVQGLGGHGLDGCALPVDRLGRVSELRRGDAVYPVGYPSGLPWGMPVVPDRVANVVGKDITFQSTFVSVGHSGGGLLNEHMELVGMITRDMLPYGLATDVRVILEALWQWGYEVQLSFPEFTPLYAAVAQGDADEVKQIIIQDCNDVTKDFRGGSTGC